jgi:hypothetical protein
MSMCNIGADMRLANKLKARGRSCTTIQKGDYLLGACHVPIITSFLSDLPKKQHIILVS